MFHLRISFRKRKEQRFLQEDPEGVWNDGQRKSFKFAVARLRLLVLPPAIINRKIWEDFLCPLLIF